MTLAKQMSDTQRPKAAGDQLSAVEVNQDLPIIMTAGEAIAATPVAVYVKDADGYIYKTTATPFSENIENFMGFATEIAGASGSAIAVQTHGIVGGFSALDAGRLYYLSDTAGLIGTAVGTIRVLVGVAISATQILVLHRRPKLGDWLSRSIDTVYQAKTDGIVCAKKEAADPSAHLTGFTDGSNPPTTERAHQKGAAIGDGVSVTFPVKKDDYWKVAKTAGGASTEAVFWIPLY